MHFDDEFDDDEAAGGLDDEESASAALGSRGSIFEKSDRAGLDPFSVKDPLDSYLLLSDDAQDEIERRQGQNMKCLSCGHRFKGEIYESCPRCGSPLTEEIGILEEE